ncbi:MAG: carboxypeptidase-like regulatory domain-containing protein [Gemmatimonadetes bacterium]|nr:carboxypeptidase-like regulatory domain-containing protein [Gemmatimonadota bacterium]
MRRRAAALAGAALLAGCGGEKAPGRIVGDAFLAQNIDQQVNLAGLPVHLLRTEETLDSTLAPLCPPRGPGGTPPPPEAWASGWHARKAVLRPLVLRSVATDEQARFAIDSVAPGQYLLWADTTLSGKRWTWLEPVRVRAGDTLRVNLTNDNPDENPLRCGPSAG